MKNRKIRLMIAGMTLGMIGWATASVAGPIPSSLNSLPAKGESDLNNFVTGDQINVDWVVQVNTGILGTTAGDGFEYLFQIENSSGRDISGFTLIIDSIYKASILAAGFLSATSDLDDDGPHNLLGEEEGFALQDVSGGTVDPNNADGINWSSLALHAGNESTTLAFVSRLAPAYGNGSVLDGTPWSTFAPGSDKLPVPAPEPTTFLGGALGLGAVAWYTRRKRAQA